MDDGERGMGRLQRVAQLWGWLPAFRAVGETQHIRQAAEVLHVSPSALSRTVGLVESDLGTDLFQRVGRRIVLTPAGVTLLEATRDAMRIVHDALLQVQSGTLSGDVRVSAPGTISRMYVLPALERLREQHPELRPSLGSFSDDALSDMLLRGDLDVALTNDPVIEPSLTSAAIGRYSSGVYCGVEHPLFGAPVVGIEQLSDHAFVAPPLDDRGRPPEGWPVELVRNVTIQASNLQFGIEVCIEGRHLAVLPDLLAVPYAEAGTLRRIDLDVIPLTPFFATHRKTLKTRGRAEILVDAVLAVAADAPAKPSAG